MVSSIWGIQQGKGYKKKIGNNSVDRQMLPDSNGCLLNVLWRSARRSSGNWKNRNDERPCKGDCDAVRGVQLF